MSWLFQSACRLCQFFTNANQNDKTQWNCKIWIKIKTEKQFCMQMAWLGIFSNPSIVVCLKGMISLQITVHDQLQVACKGVEPFYNCIVPMGFFPWEIQVAFPREPTVHAGCFSVSIIHQTLTWITGSLMCAQMLMNAIAHRGVQTHVRESALKVDSGRKFHAAPGNRTCINSMMVQCSNQLSYIPTQFRY